MIDVLSSAPHYADHLSAVFGALPEDVRGSFLSAGPYPETDRPTLVASYGDLRRAALHGRTRIAIMEHGAGQSYGGRPKSSRHGSYAGGQNRGAASLFLHPGPHPAARDRATYPGARVEVVGSPFLDNLPKREGPAGRVVAFSFHFNGALAPETKNSWRWAWSAISALRDRYDLLGHAHPRMFRSVEKFYRHAGIEAVADFADVCRRADVYVCDNSSTLFAFAATGRPVVVLNPPWYDRRIDHGLRFWEASEVGVNCDRPEDLAGCIDRALEDSPEQRAKREAALDLVYAYRDGASKRAADVLMEWAA